MPTSTRLYNCAATEHGLSGRLAIAEVILAGILFCGAVLYARATGKVSR